MVGIIQYGEKIASQTIKKKNEYEEEEEEEEEEGLICKDVELQQVGSNSNSNSCGGCGCGGFWSPNA